MFSIVSSRVCAGFLSPSIAEKLHIHGQGLVAWVGPGRKYLKMTHARQYLSTNRHSLPTSTACEAGYAAEPASSLVFPNECGARESRVLSASAATSMLRREVGAPNAVGKMRSNLCSGKGSYVEDGRTYPPPVPKKNNMLKHFGMFSCKRIHASGASMAASGRWTIGNGSCPTFESMKQNIFSLWGPCGSCLSLLGSCLVIRPFNAALDCRAA